MKESNFNLHNKNYFKLLADITSSLNHNQIKYVLVGGTGVQATIAYVLSDEGKKSIQPIDKLDALLRPTGDIDLSCQCEISDFQYILNDFTYNYKWKVYNGTTKNPRVKVPINNKKDRMTILLNYQTSKEDFKGLPMFYDKIINDGKEIYLTNGTEEAAIRVAKPEHLIASKLTRAKVKDTVDIHNLLYTLNYKNKDFDVNEVKKMLGKANKDKYLNNLDEIIKEINKRKNKDRNYYQNLTI